jgi:hypothetical protein
MRFVTVLENCIFHTSPMYEFSTQPDHGLKGEEAQLGDFSRSLLRARRERPRRLAAEQRDELDPSDSLPTSVVA